MPNFVLETSTAESGTSVPSPSAPRRRISNFVLVGLVVVLLLIIAAGVVWYFSESGKYVTPSSVRAAVTGPPSTHSTASTSPQPNQSTRTPFPKESPTPVGTATVPEEKKALPSQPSAKLAPGPAPATPATTVTPASQNPFKDVTDTLSGGINIPDGIVVRTFRDQRSPGLVRIKTKDFYAPPIEIEYVCKTNSTNIRLGYACDEIIFNWEVDRNSLRIDGGPAAGRHMEGVGRVPINKFVTIRQVVNKDNMSVFVDDELRGYWQANFSQVNQRIGVWSAMGSTVTVKSIRVKQP
jgi:hypothetical protein